MLAELLVGLVHAFERRARQLELAARLEADRAAFPAVLAAQRDDVAVLGDGIPAEALGSVSSSVLIPRSPVIWHRRVALAVEAELLVLGADAPSRWRLGTRFEIGDELVP